MEPETIRFRGGKLVVGVVLSVVFGGGWRLAAGADVSLGFECPPDVSGKAGEIKTVETYVTLTTANNPGTQGAVGWAIGLGARGAAIKGISLEEVQVSTSYDHDGNPTTPRLDPYDLDLARADFNFARLADHPVTGMKGAVSSVIMAVDTRRSQWLQPNGTARIARITLEVPIWSLPSRVILYFQDGFALPGTPPIQNTVTLNGTSVSPVLNYCAFQVEPEDPLRVTLGFEGCPRRISGAPGELKSFEAFVTLTTAGNLLPLGPDAWSFCLTAAGGGIRAISLEGVQAKTLYEDDLDYHTPPVGPLEYSLVDSYIASAGLVTSVDSREGAVSRVDVAGPKPDKRWLLPNGTSRIARVAVEVRIPFSAARLELSFPDEIRVVSDELGEIRYLNQVRFSQAYLSDPEGLSATLTPKLAGCTILIAPEFNTPAGTNVVVEPPVQDNPPVTLSFEEVQVPGNTTVEVSSDAPPPPSGFELRSAPFYYEISTTAAFTGKVRVCIGYQALAIGPEAPALFHFDDGSWVDRTVSVDDTHKVICAEVSSFSPFAIFEPVRMTFVRGDSNDDGTVDLSDAIKLFQALFLGGFDLNCRRAADANDSGEVDLSDGIAILSFLFLNGKEPPAPGPRTCGPDPTADAIEACEASSCAR